MSPRTPRTARRPLRRLLTAAVAVVVVATTAPAQAVTTEEVITLTKLGISPTEVIKAIEKDRTIFKLSVTDILTLKKAGVDEQVLKFMLTTQKRYGAPPAAGGGVATHAGTAAPAAPTLTPEQRRAREEKMRLEAQKLLAEKKRAEEAQRKAYAKGVLRKGRDLAQRGKFVASIQAYQAFVAQGNFAPDSDEAYLAKFGIAEALVKAGLYQSAAKQLVEVLLDGPDKPFFQTAFAQLRKLRKKVNYSPPDLDELTKFFVGNFSQSFQDSYTYVLGEFYYDYNDWTRALKYLNAVTPRAQDYAKAQYLKGLVEVRNQLAKSAVQSFQNAIVATESNGSDPEVRDLAFLALARIAYEVGDADAAIYYYRKVPKGSYKTSTALYESAWVYFVKGDYSRALGTFQTLHSPYFAHNFYPELWILESTIYMNLCHFDLAEAALARFRDDVAPLSVPLKRLLLKTVRPEEYYAAIVETVAGKQTYGLPKELTSPVLANVEFYNLYRTIKQIEHEQAIVRTNSTRLGEFGAKLAKKLDDLHADRVREIGIKIQRVLKETEATLADYQLKMKEIEVDLQDVKLEWEQKKLLCLDQPELCQTTKKLKGDAGGSTAIVGSDSWEWPFEGEYWVDEIGYHRAFVSDQCVKEEQ